MTTGLILHYKDIFDATSKFLVRLLVQMLLVAQNRIVRFYRIELIFLTLHVPVGEAGESVSREQPQQEGFKVYYLTVFFISF
jgi:hypothetical protein